MGNKVVVKKRKSKELTKQEMILLKKNSKLSVHEIKEFHKGFWKDFPTGRMDKKGFVKYYEKIKEGQDKSSVLCDHVFAVFDKDHNRTIDFHEFLLAVAAQSPTDLNGHLDYVFEMCDVSGDGQMDPNELATFLSAALTTMGKKEQVNDHDLKQLADGVFSTLAIGDGEKLTKEQFIQGCKSNARLRELFGGDQLT